MIDARSPASALRKAKRAGAARELDFPIPDEESAHVYFEFTGVHQLMELGTECSANEVWYEVKEMMRPMERAKEIIPPEESLYAFGIPVRKRRMWPW